MQHIKLIPLLLLTLLVSCFIFSEPKEALASCANPTSSQEAVRCGARGATGESNPRASSIDTIIERGLNLFTSIIGVIAVIMIIYAGFKYITAGGSSERVGSAKNTLIYAIVGLIIVALAQVIVRFVLANTT